MRTHINMHENPLKIIIKQYIKTSEPITHHYQSKAKTQSSSRKKMIKTLCVLLQELFLFDCPAFSIPSKFSDFRISKKKPIIICLHSSEPKIFSNFYFPKDQKREQNAKFKENSDYHKISYQMICRQFPGPHYSPSQALAAPPPTIKIESLFYYSSYRWSSNDCL